VAEVAEVAEVARGDKGVRPSYVKIKSTASG
jgi:hypothetical protein